MFITLWMGLLILQANEVIVPGLVFASITFAAAVEAASYITYVWFNIKSRRR